MGAKEKILKAHNDFLVKFDNILTKLTAQPNDLVREIDKASKELPSGVELVINISRGKTSLELISETDDSSLLCRVPIDEMYKWVPTFVQAGIDQKPNREN